MTEPKILALGKFSPNDLVVTVSESNRKIAPEIENQIDTIWDATKKAADEKGQICYNGISYRLNSLENKNGKLFLDFGTIEFKIITGLEKNPKYFDLAEEYHKRNCFACATVKTSDNRYLMVELTGKSLNINNTDLLGGIIEKPMEMKTGKDVFNSIYIELEEEGCITEADISDIYLRAIFLGQLTGIGFYFDITLNLTVKELQKRFETEGKDPDIKSLKDFSREEYLDHLYNHKSNNVEIVEKLVQI